MIYKHENNKGILYAENNRPEGREDKTKSKLL